MLFICEEVPCARTLLGYVSYEAINPVKSEGIFGAVGQEHNFRLLFPGTVERVWLRFLVQGFVAT